jgi:PAS domain S-box-containing protein
MDHRTSPVSDGVAERAPRHAALDSHPMPPAAPDHRHTPPATFVAVLDALPDAVTVVDRELHLVYLNALAAEYLRDAGVDPAALIGRRLNEGLGRILPDDYLRALERAAHEGCTVTLERHAIPLGRWIETRVVPSEGLLTLYSRDLTKRHEAERRAAESTALLHAILTNTSDAIFVKDLEGRYLTINAVGAAALHRTPDEVIGHVDADLLDGTASDELREVEAEVLRTGRTIQHEDMVLVDGVRRWFLSSRGIWRDAEGVIGGIVGIATNISERRRREQANSLLAEAGRVLAESLDYRTTLNTVAHLAVPALADWCSVLVRASDGTLETLAVAHADREREQSAREMVARYPNAPETPTGASRVVSSGSSEVYPDISDEMLATVARDATHLAMLRELGMRSAMIVPMRVHGRTLGAISLIAAESGRRFTERDLPIAEELARRSALAIENAELFEAAAAANRVKSEFLASISHELRTPLNAILGYTQLLSDGITGPVNEAQQHQLKRVRASATHLLGLIDQVLSFSRLEADREQVTLADVEVAEALDEALTIVRPLAAARDLTLELLPVPTVNGAALRMTTDALKLRQILVNLLNNAVKFTDRGSITLATRLENDDVVFTVRDPGIGIPASHLERVFEPFWQVEQAASRRVGGTGLGLSVTRRLAHLLGGIVSVQSVVGEGSAFEVRLPLAAPRAG